MGIFRGLGDLSYNVGQSIDALSPDFPAINKNNPDDKDNSGGKLT